MKSAPRSVSIGGFVTQDNLARAAGVGLAAGAGWNLLYFAARLDKGRHLACQIISVTNGQIFFRLRHAVNLGICYGKSAIIHHFSFCCQRSQAPEHIAIIHPILMYFRPIPIRNLNQYRETYFIVRAIC